VYTLTFFFFLYIYCIFLFGTAAEISIAERLVKEENEVILDRQTEVIWYNGVPPKRKSTEGTQNFTARLLHLVVNPN
jgi:hypothetical protein